MRKEKNSVLKAWVKRNLKIIYMKKITLILLISLLLTNSFAQKIRDSTNTRFNLKSKNTFFIEALGNSLFYSLNYDKILFQKRNLFISNRIGIFYLPAGGGNYKFGIPLEINFLLGKKQHFFESGLGISYLYFDDFYWLTDGQGQIFEIVDQKINWVFITGRIGYRYQKPNGGFFFRVGFTPLFQIIDKRKDKYYGMYAQPGPSMSILPFGGIGIGYTFKNKTK